MAEAFAAIPQSGVFHISKEGNHLLAFAPVAEVRSCSTEEQPAKTNNPLAPYNAEVSWHGGKINDWVYVFADEPIVSATNEACANKPAIGMPAVVWSVHTPAREIAGSDGRGYEVARFVVVTANGGRYVGTADALEAGIDASFDGSKAAMQPLLLADEVERLGAADAIAKKSADAVVNSSKAWTACVEREWNAYDAQFDAIDRTVPTESGRHAQVALLNQRATPLVQRACNPALQTFTKALAKAIDERAHGAAELSAKVRESLASNR